MVVSPNEPVQTPDDLEGERLKLVLALESSLPEEVLLHIREVLRFTPPRELSEPREQWSSSGAFCANAE